MNNYRNELKGFFTEYWKYMSVHTACKLNIFDLIQQGFNTTVSITNRLKSDKKATELLLNSLAKLKFIEIKYSKYQLNYKSILLTENNPLSLKNACILWGMEHMDAWQDLEFSIKTGKPSFLKSEKNYFDYLSTEPLKLLNYHKAMHEYAIEDYHNICEFIDFSNYNSLMDVGGGLGALISIVKNNTNLEQYFLFEKPEVIELSQLVGVNKIKGDFFIDIPQKVDCLVLSRVIHDWEDDKALKILSNCYNALIDGGNIILIENLTDKINNEASLLSLNMMLMCKSYERTEVEYSNLLNKSGLKKLEVKQLNNLQYVIIASKI